MASEQATVASESDERTANNAGDVRLDYRVLTEEEKALMLLIKREGQSLLETIELIPRSPREKALARTNLEQAVMWAVKGLTA